MLKPSALTELEQELAEVHLQWADDRERCRDRLRDLTERAEVATEDIRQAWLREKERADYLLKELSAAQVTVYKLQSFVDASESVTAMRDALRLKFDRLKDAYGQASVRKSKPRAKTRR